MQLGLGLDLDLDWRPVRHLVLYPTRSAVARREKKESYGVCTVTYCTHLLWVSGWPVGPFSSSAPGKRHLHTVTVQGGTRCRPQPERPSPGTIETLSARTVAQQTRPTCSRCTFAPRPDLPTVS